MKYYLFIFFWSGIAAQARAQEKQPSYNFPVTVTIHFPTLALPFRNLDLNFRNIGIGLGTEVRLNHGGTWLQQLHVAWLRNRHAGNGLLAYTQLVWRPDIGNNGFAEIKGGVGYLHGLTASPALAPSGSGWVTAGHKGKGMLAIPVGVGLGSHIYHERTRYSPFLGYQFMVVSHYNKTVPVVPQTLIQTGISIAQ